MSAVASADIHRCKGGDGRTLISDRPCDAAFAAPTLQSAAVGSVTDRIAAPDMRLRQSGGEGGYDFIPDRNGRGADQRGDKQAL